jgi:hypothetical protein
MRMMINENQYRTLIESYKVTLDDKKEMEDKVKKEYNDYLREYQSTLMDIKTYQIMVDTTKGNSEQIRNDFKYRLNSYMEQLSKLKSKKHDGYMLYNEFYIKNYSRIAQDFINYQTRKSGVVNFKGHNEKVLDTEMVEQYYNTLSGDEIKSIKTFLKIVAIRQDSGIGVSIDRGEVRNSFFNTPIGFQKLYSVKPSKFYWRGDDIHPCDVTYESDPNYLKMQSFSNSKTYNFGDIRFPSTRIDSYSGSFSLPLYIKYGFNSINLTFGDDEGEIMFFDVIYKCNKKFDRN